MKHFLKPQGRAGCPQPAGVQRDANTSPQSAGRGFARANRHSSSAKPVHLLFAAWIALAVLGGAALQGADSPPIVVTSPNDSGDGTLRKAILDSMPGGTIVFHPSLNGGIIGLTTAELRIDKDLTINGPGAANLAVSGHPPGAPYNPHPYRVFNILPEVTVNISNLTIERGAIIGENGRWYPGGYVFPAADAQGGGILNQGTLNLTNCVIRYNNAFGCYGLEDSAEHPIPGGDGGAASGGGIANLGTLNLTACILSNNVAWGGGGGTSWHGGYDGGDGGAGTGGHIANEGTLTLLKCTLAKGWARAGGGAVSWGGSGFRGGNGGAGRGGANTNNGLLVLINCTLNDNKATGGIGGGVGEHPDLGIGGHGGAGVGGAIASHSLVLMTNCTLSSNSATGGWGGSVDSSAPMVGQGGDGGDAAGGGIFEGVVYSIACTFATNSCAGGGGGWGRAGGIEGAGGSASGGNFFTSPDVPGVSCICAGTLFTGGSAIGGAGSSTGTSTGPDVAGHVGSAQNNFVGKADGSVGWYYPDQAGTIANPLDPKLGPLQDNGGLTLTMALLPTSPALDAVIHDGGGDFVGLVTDQRGGLRQVGAHMDVGAYEAGSYPVLNTLDSGPGSLRKAIASAQGTERIVFGPDAVGTIQLTSGEIVIQSSVTIIGPAGGLIVSGNYRSRVFSIPDPFFIVYLENLTICNGRVTGNPGTEAHPDGYDAIGGGVLNRGTLRLANCTLWNNSAIGGDGADGWPIAGYGGNASGGALANLGTLNLIQCTFATNSATGGDGGNGVLGVGGNGGAGGGGGLFNQGTLSLNSCTLNGNSAVGGNGGSGLTTGSAGLASGGGLYQDGGSAAVHNTIIANGSATGGFSIGPDVAGSVSSQYYNLVSRTNGSSGWYTGSFGTDKMGNILTPRNPLLGRLQNNGGPTRTMALLPGSPAIDAGTTNGTPVADQRGFSRPWDFPSYPNTFFGGGADIGALEMQSLPLDIGLHAHDGIAIIHIAVEPAGPLTSPFRISKNGTSYSIVLTDPTSSDASKFRIQTASGVKAWAKMP
jgi:hypothetical protein